MDPETLSSNRPVTFQIKMKTKIMKVKKMKMMKRPELFFSSAVTKCPIQSIFLGSATSQSRTVIGNSVCLFVCILSIALAQLTDKMDPMYIISFEPSGSHDDEHKKNSFQLFLGYVRID